MTRRVAGLATVAAGLALLAGCEAERGGTLLANRPPETFLSLYPDTSAPDTALASTVSQQHLFWWGDDPDGSVEGFIFSWEDDDPDPSAWQFTTRYDSVFALAISGTDTIYTFRISAVDDAGDVDPTPAFQHFPVHNTPPVVEFVVGSDVPETTFTVASFFWNGTDYDGDDTIESFFWTLDDSTQPLTQWRPLPPTTTSLTVTADSGLTAGDHVFYLLARDVAGAVSPLARMPSDDSDVWHVREPVGGILLVDDYATSDAAPSFYHEVLVEYGPYSAWDIRSDHNGDRRADLFPFSTVTLTATLDLFDMVIWYGDSGWHLEEAQVSVADYVQSGGTVIMSVTLPETFSNQGDPLGFAGVDSVCQVISIILNGTPLEATPADSLGLPQLPPLPPLEIQSSTGALFFVWGLEPLPSARVLYRLPEGSTFWTGRPVLGVWHSSNRLAFLEFPLHQVNKDNRAAELLALLVEGLG
ncbi:hypothetical protein JXA88_02165 [Candidatus Fermentibacteria bacterium]|nr:hypothetical protein [Candidatus Fermentibacteria bacterium]